MFCDDKGFAVSSTKADTFGPTVDGAWLTEHLNDPQLNIFDATVILDPDSWQANSGRNTFAEAHIPGAQFVDLISELSDPEGDVGLDGGVHAYKLPKPQVIADVLQRYGVGDDSIVVVYDTSAGMWAARLWWMLRQSGFTNVAVLDGGYAQWVAENRPVTSDTTQPVVANAPFTVRPRPELFASKDDVLGRLGDTNTVLVNALWPEQFRGEAQTPLPRKGRIPGSVNVPFTETIDESGRVHDSDTLAKLFADAGVNGDKQVVTYCGGGIAASSVALALARVGIDAAVYDGSLAEWALDPELPLEVG